MPRHRTLTGRTERQLSIRSYQTRTNRIIHNTNNNLDILTDVFKCALNVIPRNFSSYECGLMHLICRYCNAKHFYSEITRNDSSSFTLCCHKGKVSLAPLSRSTFFNDLFYNLSSSNSLEKTRSKQYFENIRAYNSAFAMISSEAKVDENVMRGVYHFKIHDVFYHRAGPLTSEYGRTPCYAQLYFYDVDTAVNCRLRESSNLSCDRSLMHQIANELDQVNPFVRSFRTMREICTREENVCKEMCMLIKVNRELDIRRFNDAIQTDVAVIFSTTDGEPPFERNMIAFSKTNGTVRNVSVLDSSLDPLAYPLLFPNGDTGWHSNITHNIASTSIANVQRNRVTMLQYAAYRLAIRDEFSLLHHSQKLYLQWIVDMYVRIEGTRLHFIKQNQSNLRSEVYNNLTDAVNQNIEGNIGRRIILPSSFIGSPRNMYQNYLDAMSIVQNFGKPSLFVTMTCNPKWPEIVNNIDPCEASNFRPDITVRVFKSKLKELIKCIVTKQIFGKVDAIIYTIEFQKRGLPHAHILISLCENDRIISIEDIDRTVCAEIPNEVTHPMLYEYVKRHMMHGPCGILNTNSVCMRDGKCSKDYPKNFCPSTCDSVNGYPMYRRRDSGTSVEVRGTSLDNRFVVPYNPYLLAKFNCHINVEVCTTIKSVKYIYKYVYKGYDSASIVMGAAHTNELENNFDEVRNYLSGRYVGSTEAVWRIFEYEMHYQSHSIVRLDIHLPNQQNVVFRSGEERNAIQNIRNTKLLAYFQLNREDVAAHQYLYTEIPLHYVWHDREKQWKTRQRGGNKIIARMYAVSPKNTELFHLRLLLLHVRGPKSFDDLKIYESFLYSSFVEACHARGIASDDSEWRTCLNEAKDFQTPKQLRNLFGFICALNLPTNPLSLWNEFKTYLSEDFIRYSNENVAFNRALLEIEDILIVHSLNCETLGLPIPRHMPEYDRVNTFDPLDEQILFDEMYSRANLEQRNLIDRVVREAQYHDTGSNVFCLTARAGCGKTFTQTAIIHRLRALNLHCMATAFSGIASTLLIEGRTLHNAFKLPIPVLDTSVANITPNSSYGRYINSVSLIIIDEISMCPIHVLNIIDKLLRDLATDEVKKNTIFGGKTILLSGDFRQILPVVPHGTRSTLIEHCIISWNEFNSFHHVQLNQNMRARQDELEFIEFLSKLGDGQLRNFPLFGEDIIEIPERIVGNVTNIIDDIYGNIRENILSERILNSVILAPTNDDCSIINNDILNRMDGEEKIYYSFDKVRSDDFQTVNEYPIEFLNSLMVGGMPPHKLILKKNCIVLLIRNLNTSQALVNGTRMRVKCLHRNSIDCEILTGVARSKRILIPRVHLTFSGTVLPFQFQRTQFPIVPAFAMTINKSQGQTFDKVGVLLRRPVFTHGQLYVAASRVRSFDGLKFYVCNEKGQGNLANDNRVFTKNIVFREVLGSH